MKGWVITSVLLVTLLLLILLSLASTGRIVFRR